MYMCATQSYWFEKPIALILSITGLHVVIKVSRFIILYQGGRGVSDICAIPGWVVPFIAKRLPRCLSGERRLKQ